MLNVLPLDLSFQNASALNKNVLRGGGTKEKGHGGYIET